MQLFFKDKSRWELHPVKLANQPMSWRSVENLSTNHFGRLAIQGHAQFLIVRVPASSLLHRQHRARVRIPT